MTEQFDRTPPQRDLASPDGSGRRLESDWEEQEPSNDAVRHLQWGALRAFIVSTAVALVGFSTALACQAVIPKLPEWRSVLIWASMVSLFGVGCVGPIAISLRHSRRVCGSLRPGLATILRVLVFGLVWSAMTSRHDDTHEG